MFEAVMWGDAVAARKSSCVPEVTSIPKSGVRRNAKNRGQKNAKPHNRTPRRGSACSATVAFRAQGRAEDESARARFVCSGDARDKNSAAEKLAISPARGRRDTQRRRGHSHTHSRALATLASLQLPQTRQHRVQDRGRTCSRSARPKAAVRVQQTCCRDGQRHHRV